MGRTITRALAFYIAAVALAACGEKATEPQTGSTTPKPVASVQVTPNTHTLTAIDATQQFQAVAKDADGATLSGKAFTWASSSPAVATANSTGLATAVTNGSSTITATTAGVSGSATVTVAQEPASLQVTPGVFSADEFTTQTFQVLFIDASGFAMPGVSFLVSADSGVGSVSPESGTTNPDGIASVSWTLGGNNETETGIEAITIMTSDGSLTHTSLIRAMPFSAVQCLDFEHSGFWISAGGCGYDGRPTGSSFDVTFRVTESDYTPIVGATVTFEVDPTCLGSCDNPGSISPTSAVTDGNGQVTVSWTLGPNVGSNRLLVSYQGRAVGVWATGD